MSESPLMLKSKVFALEVIRACNDRTILDRCVEVKRILIASINTAKESIK